MEEKTSKVIRNSGVARNLLRMGCEIIDIKPDKEDPDRKRTVFVFRKDAAFDVAMESVTNSIKEKQAREE